jgi:hypothetical protein
MTNASKRGRAQGSLLLAFCLILFSQISFGQTAETMIVRLSFYKVDIVNEPDFLAMMKDNIKPAHQLRKQNGKIVNWRLYKVHFAGKAGDYNYVSVSYYDSFDKSEPNDNWDELIKAANPKLDVNAFRTKYLASRKPVIEALFGRVDYVAPKTAAPYKYVEIDYMKVKEGKDEQYLKSEREDWKPVHQSLVDQGKRANWGLWARGFPGGTGYNYDYVTSNGFTTYSQMDDGDYIETFNKVHAGKNQQEMLDRTNQSRDLVHSELWELKEGL